jgi:hypothetical protein
MKNYETGVEEASIRQLAANGKYKTALDRAKDFHKARHSAASEALLIDAYAGRIQSLLAQNLTLEARSLLDLVRERYPSAGARLDELSNRAAARAGALDELLAPLADASLEPQRRAAIEEAVQNNVADLAAIAASPVLAAGPSLRVAAGALERAFAAVTSGPVTDEQLALPEISRRSPLAPWTMLVRAVAYFYRGEDAHCRELLATVKPESVPARLVPAMLAMLGGNPVAPLTAAANALTSRTVLSSGALRKELSQLDAAFDDEEAEGRIYKLVRSAMQECRRSAPGQVTALKRLLYVRGAGVDLDIDRMEAALGGLPPTDATLFRSLARDMESGPPSGLALACETWDRFRQSAVDEGWFTANGVEAATLYLHMANLLKKIPHPMLRDLQTARRRDGKKGPEELYFLFPERLYGRACALDPHREAFAQWHKWAADRSVSSGEDVATAWHKVRPADIEPLLYLMQGAEKRSAFPTALGYLNKAERIDAVHSEVRAARMRLLAASALRHLQQKRPHLAAEKLAAMTVLPQSRQGDRPAFIEAVHYLIALTSGDEASAGKARAELEKLLGDQIAAGMLVASLARASKFGVTVQLPAASSIGKASARGLLSSVARLSELARDLGIVQFKIPPGYLGEAHRRFPQVCDSLTVSQLATLGETALAEGNLHFAYAISDAGMNREGSTLGPRASGFLLLRSRSLPDWASGRRSVCAAAAAELARSHGDMDVVGEALELLREGFDNEPLSLTLKQAGEVMRTEKGASTFPVGARREPDYNGLLPGRLCDCPECRSARGELPDSDCFDEIAMRRLFDEKLPDGIPPDAAEELFDLMKNAFLNGETAEDIFGGMGKGKKRKRK